MKKLYKILYLVVMPIMLIFIDINLYLKNIEVSTSMITLYFVIGVFHLAAILAFIHAYKMEIIIAPRVEVEFIKGIGFYIGFDDDFMIALPFIGFKFRGKRKFKKSNANTL